MCHKPYFQDMEQIEEDYYDSEEHAVEIYTETMNLIDEWIDEQEKMH